MKSIEVEGSTLVRDYRRRELSRLDLLAILLCVLAVAFFIIRLAI